MAGPRKILIDTDPGVDDAMAIFYALSSPELDVVALTTVFGNVDVELCTTNALRLLEIADRTDIPVARGASQPMAMPRRGAADFVHGRNGQGDAPLRPPSTSPVSESAVDLIIQTVMAYAGEITLVPLGPLTNIAAAMTQQPDLTDHLVGIVLMGGNAFCGGNASPAGEANILNDPEAADIVFGATCEVVMAGLDVTEQTVMTTAELRSLATIDNPRAQHLAAITPFYRDFYFDRLGLDGIFVHDSATISYLLAPELFGWVEQPVRVDCGSSVCRGKTLSAARVADDESPWFGRRPVRILTSIDGPASVALELTRLAGAS